MALLSNHSTLVIATHNAGKVKEINALLVPFAITARPASDFGLAEPEETGATFAENAALKARAAMKATGLPALADDSGLAVHPLNGEPGIYSARWAGADKNFTHAMKEVIRRLQETGLPQSAWKGAFICHLCLALPNGSIHGFEGKVEGHIIPELRGHNGFGYDPLFVPQGHSRTFGEMEAGEKQHLSHRRRAFDAFIKTAL